MLLGHEHSRYRGRTRYHQRGCSFFILLEISWTIIFESLWTGNTVDYWANDIGFNTFLCFFLFVFLSKGEEEEGRQGREGSLSGMSGIPLIHISTYQKAPSGICISTDLFGCPFLFSTLVNYRMDLGSWSACRH